MDKSITVLEYPADGTKGSLRLGKDGVPRFHFHEHAYTPDEPFLNDRDAGTVVLQWLYGVRMEADQFKFVNPDDDESACDMARAFLASDPYSYDAWLGKIKK